MLGANVHNLVDYKRKNSQLVQVTEQSQGVSSNNEANTDRRYSRQVSPLTIRVPGGKRVDRFGVQVEKGSKEHKVCFADDRPNGKTSGVILVKTYNVESYKEFNKLNDSSSKLKPSTKDKYIDESSEYSCTCAMF